jgi:hypothetical protein
MKRRRIRIRSGSITILEVLSLFTSREGMCHLRIKKEALGRAKVRSTL